MMRHLSLCLSSLSVAGRGCPYIFNRGAGSWYSNDNKNRGILQVFLCLLRTYNQLLGQPTAFLLYVICCAHLQNFFIGQPNGIHSPFNLLNCQPVAHLLHRTSLVNPAAFLPHSTCLLVNLRRTYSTELLYWSTKGICWMVHLRHTYSTELLYSSTQRHFFPIQLVYWSTCGAPSSYNLLTGQPVAHLLHKTSLLINPT